MGRKNVYLTHFVDGNKTVKLKFSIGAQQFQKAKFGYSMEELFYFWNFLVALFKSYDFKYILIIMLSESEWKWDKWAQGVVFSLEIFFLLMCLWLLGEHTWKDIKFGII